MRDGFVVHGAEGAIGGVLGTLLIKQTLALSRRIQVNVEPKGPSRDPADVVVSRIEEASGRPLSGRAHERIVEALHWAYGIGWGGLLGLAVAGLHVRRSPQIVLAGAGMGALVWAVGYSDWLPRPGLARPAQRQDTRQMLTSLATHVTYGIAASVPILIIDRLRERREPAWRRLASRARGFR